MNTISQNTLMQLRDGDRAAFRIIYDNYASSIYSVAHKILKDNIQAEEVVQECFMKLWLARAELNTALDLWPYIYVICKRICFNYIRDQKLTQALPADSEMFAVNDVEQKVHYFELQLQLDQYVETLPEQQKKAWQLSRIEGCTHEQIATQMGISKHTVKNHISQALKSLRNQLTKIDYFYFFVFLYLF